jgi:hypothetical protein
MTKLAIFLILSLGLTVVSKIQAQAKEEIYYFTSMGECAKFGDVESFVQKQHGEKPFTESKIILRAAKNGRLYEGNLVTYVNPDTKSFSLVVQFEEDGYSCIIGAGSDFGPAFTKGIKL